MLIGSVYRLRVTKIPRKEGIEVFPTIELIDRLYPPPGQETRFPIPIELTEKDLELAASGNFVTRIIYLEDPRKALPLASRGHSQNWFDAAPHEDPLVVADTLGRPMAILRIGGRLPADPEMPDAQFMYNSPPLIMIPPGDCRPMQEEIDSDEPAAPKSKTQRTDSRKTDTAPRTTQQPRKKPVIIIDESQPSPGPSLEGRGVITRGQEPGFDGCQGRTLPREAFSGYPGDGYTRPGPMPWYAQPEGECGPPLPLSTFGPWRPSGISCPWPADEYICDGGEQTPGNSRPPKLADRRPRAAGHDYPFRYDRRPNACRAEQSGLHLRSPIRGRSQG